MLKEYIASVANKVDIFKNVDFSRSGKDLLIWFDGPMCFLVREGGFVMVFSVADEKEVEPKKWVTVYEVYDATQLNEEVYQEITHINSGVNPDIHVVVEYNEKNEAIIVDYIEGRYIYS